MKWNIEEKTLNDIVKVLADPGVRASEPRLAQRIKVGAAGGKPAEHGLQQPRRFEFAPSGLRMNQPCEVEARHQEAGAPCEDRQHRRLYPTDGKTADRREERHRDVRQGVTCDPSLGQPPAVMCRQPLEERASAGLLWRTAFQGRTDWRGDRSALQP